LKAQEIRNSSKEFMPTLGKKSGRGRPEKPDSQETIAKEIGIPRQTLQDAQAHVEAVNKYPKLEPLPKTQAIKTAKILDTLPAEERPKVLEMINKPEPKQPEQKTPEEEERDKHLRRAQNFRANAPVVGLLLFYLYWRLW